MLKGEMRKKDERSFRTGNTATRRQYANDSPANLASTHQARMCVPVYTLEVLSEQKLPRNPPALFVLSLS